MKMKKVLFFVLATAMLLTTSAASLFEQQPAEAAQALRATRGKPFSSGYVFINGKYVKPPYVVERYGTVIRINGMQVSKPLVAWDAFMKTQTGKAESVEVKPEIEKKAEPVVVAAQSSDDKEDDLGGLDDLFETSKPAKTVVAPPPPVAARPATKKQLVKTNFVPNEKSRALVAKINASRLRIDKFLRKGGYYCFGTRYSPVSGDAKTAKQIMSKLPGIMKNNAEKESFHAAMRNAGFSFLPNVLIDDFHRNRFDYFSLNDRLKEEQEKTRWQSLIE